MALLEIKNLSVEFETRRGPLKALDSISFEVNAGETVSLVGESGCGKSITSLAIMGLLATNGRITSGDIVYNGQSLVNMPENKRRELRGRDIAMIFQDPMTSLNPAFTVGQQLIETIAVHEGGTKESLKNRARELLVQVGIPAPDERLNAYPHQLSGGMSQRVMIAIAIACRPKVLIADEPTTALDVTIQAQILELLRKLQREQNMGLILITHDLGIVSETADRVLVMYAGQVVENGVTSQIIGAPSHPYTKALLDSLPAALAVKEASHRTKLPSISGMVPDLARRPSGCQFHPRCTFVENRCMTESQVLVDVGSKRVRCFKPLGAEK